MSSPKASVVDTLKEIEKSIKMCKDSIAILKGIAPYNPDVKNLLRETEYDLEVMEKVKEQLAKKQ